MFQRRNRRGTAGGLPSKRGAILKEDCFPHGSGVLLQSREERRKKTVRGLLEGAQKCGPVSKTTLGKKLPSG